MDDDPRTRLNELAELLRPLHRALLDESRAEFERDHGPVGGPAALFQLVTGHPHFAWLRPLSRYMADLDERLDEPAPIEPAQGKELRQRLERLLVDEAADEGFARRYLPTLQRSTEVVVAHAAVRAVLGKL